MHIHALKAIGAIFLLSSFGVGSADAQAYELRPLRAPTAFAVTSMPTEPGPFMSWLGTRANTLSEDGVSAAREQLFAIIAAAVKQRVRSGSPALAPSPDSLVAQLYEWGHRLGLPGARLVALRLGYSPRPSDPAPLETPGISIRFDSMYTVVGEADGWMVRFPHYFMIGTASRQLLGNGAETGILVLSTLFAKDATARPGASQATIMLLSAGVPAPEMTAFWLQQLGMTPGDTVANTAHAAVRTYRARDSKTRMTKEMVVFAPAGRTILAVYAGNDGTYETNRPHFLDLLNSLRIRPRT